MTDHSRRESGAEAARILAVYLANWGGAPGKGCRAKGLHGGLTSIELRYPDPETGEERHLLLRPVVREGTPIIEVIEGPVAGG